MRYNAELKFGVLEWDCIMCHHIDCHSAKVVALLNGLPLKSIKKLLNKAHFYSKIGENFTN